MNKVYSVALVIGHTERAQGANSAHPNVPSEWVLNTDIAKQIIATDYESKPFDIIYNMYHYNPYSRSYGDRVRELNATKLDNRNFDLVVEMHYNASRPTGTGVEALHAENNANAQQFGAIFNQTFEGMFYLRNRGTKVPGKWNNNRGRYFLERTKSDAVITEPFFGTNLKDIRKIFGDNFDYQKGVERLAGAYVLSFHQYFALIDMKNFL